ncbi:S8 family serine peptidase [Mesorhizobium sp. CA7]|uniref:S8 family serine peptidase n=1 Tax=Mesorhizobium sp. CA7 TaxID=588501 RepID=UPI001CD00917|nr:S8 family serine peptidase [Mesorhizobium sp. CA7]MBZ9815732.1 S8 family peptidase [Mesorhizobium sp. CA7]
MVKFALACLYLFLLLQFPARADEMAQGGSGILLSFEGGQANQNLAAVLKSLEDERVLGRREYVVQPNDSICSILQGLNYPPPCGGYDTFVQYFNKGLDPSRLQVGSKIVLPDLDFTKFTAVRRYEGHPGDDTKVDGLESAWKHLDASKKAVGPAAKVVTYDAYQTFVPTTSDDRSVKTIKRIGESKIPNLAVDLIPATPLEQKVYSLADKVKEACLVGNFPATLEYQSLSSYDEAALSHAPNTTLQPVAVHLIDEPLLEFPTASDLAGKPCRWGQFDQLVHHSTLLASIIASPDIGNGFIGLAPNALIKSVEWVKAGNAGGLVPAQPEPGRSIRLGRTLTVTAQQPPPLDVYLAATLFPPSRPGVIGYLEKAIKDSGQLLIVAAGESEAGKPPVSISAASTQSPQNLGHLPNVVVVSACTTCGHDDVQLMPEAYFSAEAEDQPIVHVVAPGGLDVPGWIGNQAMGAAPGTSQASAFVAGAVAKMMGFYSNVYASAYIVKKRVQTTSWPIPDPKIAAGVVDPVLMALNPESNWIKTNGQWKPVSLRSAEPAIMNFQSVDNGLNNFIGADSILRVTKLDDQGTLAVYYDLALSAGKPYGSVGKLYRVAPEAPVELTACDGTEIDLTDVEDLLVKVGSAFGC